MNRENRRRRLQLKPHLDKLETRRLMSVGVAKSHFAHVVQNQEVALESQLARGDLNSFALTLAQHPRMAADLGLGALSRTLRSDERFASRHGWGASLVRELTTHPRYAAAHHLTNLAALSPPPKTTSTPPSQTTVITTTQPNVQGNSGGLTQTTVVTDTSPAGPPVVVQDPLSIAVGGTLDVTLPNLGLGGKDLTYIITPQPLPANMTFNLGTGELVFAPAPGQAGVSNFSVAVSNGTGSGTIKLPITVTAPVLPSTEVSGQVVDENGQPLAGMPVNIGGSKAITDQSGDFTLTAIPVNPGPISAGGSAGSSQGRQDLTAPVVQLLGHDLYAGADNVMPSPLILPKINWSSPTSFTQTSVTQPLDLTNPAMPGFDIQLQARAAGSAPAAATLQVAVLSAALSAQHMPQGVSSGMLVYNVAGSNLSGPVRLTLPAPGNSEPGAILSLLTINSVTGGHDVASLMVVSADGKTMTSMGLVALFHTGGTSSSGSPPVATPDTGYIFSGCLIEADNPPVLNPVGNCAGCQLTGSGTASPGNSSPGGAQVRGAPQTAMNSDAGLVTGEYFQDHQLATYQSQGQNIGIDLQYTTSQAYPNPVVHYQFTTPAAGNSASITMVTAQVTLAGVGQGSAVTYNTPTGLIDGTTYNIPLQVNGSALPAGVYPYTMTVSEYFSALYVGGIEWIPATVVTSTAQGSVDVVNSASDLLGAGWSIGGFDAAAQVSSGGPVLLTQGQQGTESFDPVYNSGQSNIQDLALVSGTAAAQIMANDGMGNFSISGTPSDTNLVGTASGDFNGDGKPDVAVVNSTTLAILLNNGSGGFTAGSSYTLPSGYEAKAIAVGNFSGHSGSVLDIAVLLASTSTNAYYVAEYTGTGTGTFGSPVISPAGNGVSSSTGPDSIAAADFNGDGKTDLAFNTDDGLADLMLATSGGSFSSATSLSLPSGHLALGVTTLDYNGDGKTDLVVEADNTNVVESGTTFYGVALDLLTGNGSGGFTDTSTYQTVGQTDIATIGLVSGDFQGTTAGLEVAVPITNGGGGNSYIDVVPLSTSGAWGLGVAHPVGSYSTSSTHPGNIVAADLNGTGKPSIALVDSDTGQVELLRTDPESNQFLPTKYISVSGGSAIGMLAVAPFKGVAATPGFRGPTSAPSTLVKSSGGSWTMTYPDDTVISFNSSGQETSETDRNGNTFSYGYITSGPATGALATITDPVGLITTLAYNSTSGHLQTVTDPAGRVTTITIDSNDNLTQIVDPDGAITTYGYSDPSNHEINTETEPNGSTASAYYNTFGQLTSETLFDGTSTTEITPAQSRGLINWGGSGSLLSSYQGSVTDPDGRITTLTFNWMSHVVNEEDALFALTTMIYDGYGFAAGETDPLGRTTTLSHDVFGDVTAITEPYVPPPGGSAYGLNTETITYNDNFGVPTSITDFNGNTTTFTLDSHGNVTQETQPGGVNQEWTYNSAGQVLAHTDANNNTTSYAYDTYGRMATITEPGAGSPTVRLTYDSAGDVASVTDEAGDTVSYTYDNAGRVLTEQDPVQAAAGKETSFTYDHDGNLLTATDANGHIITYVYNSRNEEVSMTDALGKTTSYAYDADGNLTSITDPLSRTVTFAYDADNREVGTTDGAGDRTTYTLDADGEVTSATDPNSNTIQYTYDALGRVQTEVLPVYGSSSGGSHSGGGTHQPAGTYTYGYDLDGNLRTVTDPNNYTVTYTYNTLNEQTAVTNADGNTTSYAYDGDGNVLTLTDGLGHTVSYTYDAMSRELTQKDPSGGGTTTYAYDPAGRMTSLKDPDNNVTTWTYTHANEVATEVNPLGYTTTYTYDLVGNVTSVTGPDGHTVSYTYDGDNRETSETWVNPSGGSALNVISYTYDADGELTKVSDNYATYSYTYNSAGEQTTASDTGTTGLAQVTLTYAYDPNGNRTSMSDSLSGVVSYTYDEREELANETLSGTGISAEGVAYTYDEAGNLTGAYSYSNLTETTGVVSTTFSYDHADQVTGITDKNSGGTTLVSYAYTYDAASRVSQEVRNWNSGSSTDTLTYSYTNNDQLTGVSHTNSSFSTESFSYDANGNQTGTGYTTTTDNEQTASPGYTYTFDHDGNLITSTQTSTGYVWTYTYDYRNRMTGAVEKTSGGTTLEQVTYTYDALDNRIGMDENGMQTWTLYDGSSPIMDFNSSGSLTMRYLNGPTGIVARQTSGGTVSWYLADALGTVRDLISNSGSIIDHVDYSAFGTVLDESSPSNGDRMMGFAGMERDTVTGLNLAVHRVENPGTGRWDSQDPRGFTAGDGNLYRYTGNSPSNSSDPLGLGDGPQPMGPGRHKKPKKGKPYRVGNDPQEGFEGTERYKQDQLKKKPKSINPDPLDQDWEGEKIPKACDIESNDKSRRRPLSNPLDWIDDFFSGLGGLFYIPPVYHFEDGVGMVDQWGRPAKPGYGSGMGGTIYVCPTPAGGFNLPPITLPSLSPGGVPVLAF